jgi:hypothetical protein
MCVVSFIQDNIPPWIEPYKPNPTVWPDENFRMRELERRVVELEKMVKDAKQYDIDNGEPECEVEEKLEIVRKLCKELGIDPKRLT